MNIEMWNFWVWNQFNNKIYNQCFNNDDIVNEESTEFYEKLVRIENSQTIEYEVPEEHRECIRIKKKGRTYLMPVQYSKQMPLKVSATFKCQIKPSDHTIYYFVTEITSQNVTGESYDKSFRGFVDEWNPVSHSDPKHWTLLKMIALASIIKPLKVALCSEPNTGKNANFTLIGKMLNNVGRFGTPTLAVFERSLYYNQVTLIDEITSIAPAQMRELEPIILTVSDNSPDYKKHSLAQKSFLNNVDLGETSLVFPFNRKVDVGQTGGKFFDEVWNNLPAFKSRFPQLLVKGEVLTHMPQLSKPQSKKIMEIHFEDMRKIVKQLVYWKHNLHKHLEDYKFLINISNRHLTNIQSLIDVFNVYSETQDEFNEWCVFLLERIRSYDNQFRVVGEEGQTSLVATQEMIGE